MHIVIITEEADLKSSIPHSDEDLTRVIGVYAYSKPGEVFLYEEACVVGGSEELIRRYMALLTVDPKKKMKISKVRFGSIYEGLKKGAAYAFDRTSYTRFYALARRAGIHDLEGFPKRTSEDFHFIKVQFDQADFRPK